MFSPEIIFSKEQYEKYYSERFIYGEELLRIAEIMKTHDHYRILVCGAPGSGKSTLLRLLSHYTENKMPIEIIKGRSFCESDYNFMVPPKVPLFIDGLDEIVNPYDRMRFLSDRKFNKLVCTSRPYIPMDAYFTHIVTLNPLTQNQIMMLIKKLGLSDRLFDSLMRQREVLDKEVTPKDVLSYVIGKINNSYLQDFYSQHNHLLYQYGNGIDFSSDIIYSPNEIILPSREIITDIAVVDDSLLKRAKQDPRIMLSFSPREFEEMVCELLDKQGYKVKLTKQTRDGGKDIIVVQKSFLGDFCIYVECKKYDISRPISVGLVRELYGTVMVDNATAGMIVTTSHFTRDAKEYSAKIQHRMTLKDYNDLVQELNRLKMQ